MGISLGKGLLIAGGVGLAGLAAYSLFKPKDGEKKAEGADPAAGGATGTGAGTGTPATGTVPGAGTGTATTGTPGAAAANGLPAGAQQVGAYTVIPDAQSGMSLVLETATQTPVGIMDAQGNVTPVTVDASGNIVPAQQQSTQDALGTGATGQATGSIPSTSPYVDAGSTASASQSYESLAKQLFANASDPTVGTASSDAMSGAGAITGTPSPTPAGTGGSAATAGAYQQGQYTVIPDQASGVSLVLDTASQQPVGILDAQGNVTPVTVDANGQLQLASPAATSAAPAGVATNAPAMQGAGAPAAGSSDVSALTTAPMTSAMDAIGAS